jgi:flotillin
MAKIEKLPELAERMMKPVEKIDSIRINQVSGLGIGTGGSTPLGGAADAVLNLALQLPAMQKLGEQIGLNLDLGKLGEIPKGEATPERKK